MTPRAEDRVVSYSPRNGYIASVVCAQCGGNVYGHSPKEFMEAIRTHVCGARK